MWIMENRVDGASNNDVEQGTAHFGVTSGKLKTRSNPQ